MTGFITWPVFCPVIKKMFLTTTIILPESKTDAIDEKDQNGQTEDSQQSVHPNLQVWQASAGVSQLTAPSHWDFHLSRDTPVVTRFPWTAAPATASTRCFAAWGTGDDCALGRRADLEIKGNINTEEEVKKFADRSFFLPLSPLSIQEDIFVSSKNWNTVPCSSFFCSMFWGKHRTKPVKVPIPKNLMFHWVW